MQAASLIESQDEHSVVTVLKPDMMTVPHRDLSLTISNCVCAQSSFILCGLIHLHFPWCIYWSPVVFELVSGNKYLIQESVFCKDRLYCHRVSMIMLFTTLSLKFFLKTTCFGFFKFFLNSIFIFIFFSLSFLCCGQSTS